ncbi:MAG: pesticin C-terminus-like muramidase [Pseudomonadota bacterium]
MADGEGSPRVPSVPLDTPTFGLPTWAAEGQEGGPYHSRVPHVPSPNSGVTVGRGYDLKERDAAAVIQDLMASGVSKADAEALSKGVGLRGDKAKEFIEKNLRPGLEITSNSQLKLFERAYGEKLNTARRVCDKADVVRKYGRCDWDALDPAIQDIVVDMTFRGDYRPNTREFVQCHIVENDLVGLRSAVLDPQKVPGVPPDRQKIRADFFDHAIAEREQLAKREACIVPALKS